MDTTLKLEKEMTVEEIKTFLGTLKKDLKNVQKGELRTVFLNEILDVHSSYLNEMGHSENFKNKFKEGKEAAREFLYNKDEEDKAGWNYTEGKKNVLAENIIKQKAWADKAYFKADVNLWDAERDIDSCVEILKGL